MVYDLNDTYSVYASYTKIYQPQIYKDVNGKTLEPVEGDSYETGLKAAYFEGKLNASLALFRIEQDNVAQYVTTDSNTGRGRLQSHLRRHHQGCGTGTGRRTGAGLERVCRLHLRPYP